MKVLVSSLVFILSAFTICEAGDKLNWFYGKIIMNDDSEVVGELSYNYRHGVIMMKDEQGNTKAYSAAQASYFEFFDEFMQVPRKYLSLPFFTDKNYRSNVFFELVMEGEIAIFRKEKKHINLDFIMQHDNESFSRYHASFNYYAFAEGKFIPLKEFPEKLLPVVSEKYVFEINEFIQANGLNPEIAVHAILIIDYYNTLFDSNYQKLQLVQAVEVE